MRRTPVPGGFGAFACLRIQRVITSASILRSDVCEAAMESVSETSGQDS